MMSEENQLHIALLQSSLIWENPERNRNIFAEKIAGIGAKTDLIILPEMFTTGFTMQPQHIDAVEGEKTIAWMQQTAVEKNVALLGSIPFFENEAYTNRLFFVHQDGSYQYYD